MKVRQKVEEVKQIYLIISLNKKCDQGLWPPVMSQNPPLNEVSLQSNWSGLLELDSGTAHQTNFVPTSIFVT